jgi:hypothetical protein
MAIPQAPEMFMATTGRVPEKWDWAFSNADCHGLRATFSAARGFNFYITL